MIAGGLIVHVADGDRFAQAAGSGVEDRGRGRAVVRDGDDGVVDPHPLEPRTGLRSEQVLHTLAHLLAEAGCAAVGWLVRIPVVQLLAVAPLPDWPIQADEKPERGGSCAKQRRSGCEGTQMSVTPARSRIYGRSCPPERWSRRSRISCSALLSSSSENCSSFISSGRAPSLARRISSSLS
jgi:hypothetical protein